MLKETNVCRKQETTNSTEWVNKKQKLKYNKYYVYIAPKHYCMRPNSSGNCLLKNRNIIYITLSLSS